MKYQLKIYRETQMQKKTFGKNVFSRKKEKLLKRQTKILSQNKNCFFQRQHWRCKKPNGNTKKETKFLDVKNLNILSQRNILFTCYIASWWEFYVYILRLNYLQLWFFITWEKDHEKCFVNCVRKKKKPLKIVIWKTFASKSRNFWMFCPKKNNCPHIFIKTCLFFLISSLPLP